MAATTFLAGLLAGMALVQVAAGQPLTAELTNEGRELCRLHFDDFAHHRPDRCSWLDLTFLTHDIHWGDGGFDQYPSPRIYALNKNFGSNAPRYVEIPALYDYASICTDVGYSERPQWCGSEDDCVIVSIYMNRLGPGNVRLCNRRSKPVA